MVTQQLAAAILHLGKKLAPDRFPKPDPETATAWARALNRDYPPALWEDAVYLWATELAGDRMCTPKDMLGAAKDTVRRWETDPAKKPVLEHYRHQRLEHKYQLMLGDRYTPQSVPPPASQAIEPPVSAPDFDAMKRNLAKSRRSA